MSLSSNLEKILPSLVQTLRKRCSSCASLNFSILLTGRLSVIEIFLPLSFFLFLNILLPSLNQTNFNIIGRGFSPCCLDWPILWLLSMSWGAISISKFWFIISIIISSMVSPLTSLIPCTRRHYVLEYCSCWSACFSSFETLLNKVLTSDWRFPIISFFFEQNKNYRWNLWSSTCLVFQVTTQVYRYKFKFFAKLLENNW